MADAPRLEDWIGRRETLIDSADGAMIDRLNAALDSDDRRLQPGDPLPPLAHWCLFLPVVRASETGPDGHPARGGFLPPVHHLPRRMWAGSRLWFPGDITAGMRVRKTSTILSVKEREGATGPLIFVTVRHEITEEGGGPLLVADEHDIVYRSIEAAAAKPAPPAPGGAVWRRELVPDPVLLFRYSAVTFNGHRIHYDRSYVTQVEGYPGLVVHGPLTATLMMDLVRRSLPQARIRRFSFRAVSPLFDGAPMSVNAIPPGDDGIVKVWAANATGGLAMHGEAEVG